MWATEVSTARVPEVLSSTRPGAALPQLKQEVCSKAYMETIFPKPLNPKPK